MPDSSTLTLECPLCPEKHIYPVEVRRHVVLGITFITPRGGEPAKVVRRRFERAFICPTTGKRFIATLVLSETPMDRIEDVTIGEPEE